MQKKSDLNLINFEGTRTIFTEVAKHDVEVVVYTSTESILTGNARRNKLVDAAVERRLNEMPDPYCRSKFQRHSRHAEKGLPVVIGCLRYLCWFRGSHDYTANANDP